MRTLLLFLSDRCILHFEFWRLSYWMKMALELVVLNELPYEYILNKMLPTNTCVKSVQLSDITFLLPRQ